MHHHKVCVNRDILIIIKECQSHINVPLYTSLSARLCMSVGGRREAVKHYQITKSQALKFGLLENFVKARFYKKGLSQQPAVKRKFRLFNMLKR